MHSFCQDQTDNLLKPHASGMSQIPIPRLNMRNTLVQELLPVRRRCMAPLSEDTPRISRPSQAIYRVQLLMYHKRGNAEVHVVVFSGNLGPGAGVVHFQPSHPTCRLFWRYRLLGCVLTLDRSAWVGHHLEDLDIHIRRCKILWN